MPPRLSWRVRARRGAVLVWFALSFVGLMGIMGLALDVGRMYTVKTEAQSFVDAGTLAAAAALDGTASGIAAANTAAQASWTKYHFGSKAFAAPLVQFAQTSAGPWVSYDTAYASPAGHRFVQVTSNVSLSMMLMPAITNVPNATIAARAVSGQVKVTSIDEGLFPFSIIAHNDSAAAADGYGLVKGYKYSMRWESGANSDLQGYLADPTKGSNQQKVAGFCNGDLADTDFLQTLNTAVQAGLLTLNDRGFLEGSASDLTNAVLGGYQSTSHSIGDVIDPTQYASFANGAKQSIVSALDQRAGSTASPPIGDSNHTDYGTSAPASNYTNFNNSYYNTGNGRRIVVAPLTRPPTTGSNVILDFALFLLDPDYPTGANNSWCAMYLGSGVKWVYHKGVSNTGLYDLRLIQ